MLEQMIASVVNEYLINNKGKKYPFVLQDTYKGTARFLLIHNQEVFDKIKVYKQIFVVKSTLELEYFVFVDDNFVNLDEDARDFFIMHEIGHVVHGDLENPSTAIISALRPFIGLFSAPEMEYSADEYAVKKIGVSAGLKALNESLKIKNANKPEIRHRIKRIKQLNAA